MHAFDVLGDPVRRRSGNAVLITRAINNGLELVPQPTSTTAGARVTIGVQRRVMCLGELAIDHGIKLPPAGPYCVSPRAYVRR